MGYPEAVDVDAEQLLVTAGKVQDATDIVSRCHGSRSDDLAPAAHHAWASAAAARSASSTWATFVDRLNGSLGDLATDMRTAANRYEEEDRQAASDIRTSGPQAR